MSLNGAPAGRIHRADELDTAVSLVVADGRIGGDMPGAGPLSMDDVHGVADLRDAPAPGGSRERANEVVPAWFARYEAEHALPIIRPLRVRPGDQ